MTNLELALNMFAESATAELHKEKNPHGYNASAKLAQAGGKAAEAARLNLEEQPVSSSTRTSRCVLASG